jgi:response regulator RpfG family c-di-GMP phosphodiesterase
MKGKILLVDDEINILNSYKRILRGHFDVDTAEHASIAIEMLKKNNYCVIVSDMSMPDINGIKLLNFSKKIKPNTVRIMLTGNADQKTATDAVNVGDVYRFINKPCSAQEFIDNINDAIKYHNLIIAEKLILSKTVKGIISVLNDVISLVCPQTSDRTIRLSHHMLLLADELEIKSTWSFEPMIQLSQLGYILFPDSEMSKTNNRNQQTEEELQLFNQHPCLAADLISKIPKMEGIANTILYQEKCYDGH